jgi:hypothetical protein
MLRRLNGSFGRLGKFMWVMGGAAALLLALLLVASSSGHTHALGRVATAPAAASTVEVGTGLPGLNLYEFVGRVDQAGVAFTGYGYLSYVKGMDNSQIFSNPLNPSEGTAHFTYYATATLTSRAVISSIFAIDSVGPITFYYQPTPSAAFDNPASFAAGTPIATGVIRYQSILNVQAPNQGISDGIGEFVQATAGPFSIGGTTYQFGQAGMVERMTTFGQGTRLDALLPKSFVVLSGNAVDTGQRQLQLPYVSKDTSD